MPGLALSLGAPNLHPRLPDTLAHRVEGKGWRMLKGAPSPSEMIRLYSELAPDGVRFLELGKLPGQVVPEVSTAFRYLMERLRARDWTVVADLAAGTRQPMFRWTRFAEVVVIVVEPTVKSTMTARRLLPIATHAVANKVRSAADVELIRRRLPLPLLAAVPYDEAVLDGERQGFAPIDYAIDSPAVKAAGEIALRLTELAG
ncbi:MAG: hypothetical protein NVS9B1_27070 [Candidatus Dormibacteraceae bacterium]